MFGFNLHVLIPFIFKLAVIGILGTLIIYLILCLRVLLEVLKKKSRVLDLEIIDKENALDRS